MRFGQAVIAGFRNFANLSGRAGVDEYWHLARFTQVAAYLLVMAVAFVSVRAQSEWMRSMAGLSKGGSAAAQPPSFAPIGYVFVATVLALSVPRWTCGVRRLHDTGRTGWHYIVPALVAFSVLALAYAAFVPADVHPLQVLLVLFTPIWIYEPQMILGLVAFAILVIWMRKRLTRKLREPSQTGTNRFGPPPFEVTP